MLVALVCATAVVGRVRAEATGDSLPGARIELVDARAAVWADAAGRYTLCLDAAGPHRVRFAAPGFDAQLVDVQVPAGARLQLDVALPATTAHLDPMRIVAAPLHGDDAPAVGPVPNGAAWQASAADVRGAPVVDEPDLFRALSAAPGVHAVPEAAAAGLHLRGGSGDQTRYLLDGAPVYSPVHPGTLASALGPDLVARATLHDAVPPARVGNALSGVVDVRTPPSAPDEPHVRGEVGSTSLGATARLPFADGHAELLVSGRHTYRGLDRDGTAVPGVPDVWSDRYARLALRRGADDLALSVFAADNIVAFPTSADAASADPAAMRDRFAWSSRTVGASWRRPLGSGAALDVHAWDARLATGAAWGSDGFARSVRAGLDDAGATAAVALPGAVTVGGEVRRIATRYAAAGGTADSTVAALRAAPAFGALFVETRQQPWQHWTLDAGLRETLRGARRPLLEPRVALRFAPTPTLTVGLGLARTHQFSQTLRNEESLLSTVVGADPEVAADGRRVPVAAADQLSATAAITLPRETSIQIDAYARRLDGLLLVAPATSEPFALGDVARGHGRAWGTSVTLRREGPRLAVQAGYAVGQTVRTTDALRYHPSFAPDQSAFAAASVRAAPHTVLRAAVWTTSARATSLIGDDIAWENRDGAFGARELSGTPVHVLGALDAAHLPLYVRMDVGVRHTMPVRTGALTLFASVNNALARENAAALVATGTDAQRRVPMVPFSVVFGLSWRY